jgi:uncharacterized membrane protein
MDTTNGLEQNSGVLEITEDAKKYLKTTSVWTNFMAIFNFVVIAFMVLAGIMLMVGFTGNTGYGMPQIGSMGLFYIVVAIIMLFPALYLLRFSRQTANALSNQDTLALEDAFKNMKSYWMFMGIFAIVMITIVIISALSFVMSLG